MESHVYTTLSFDKYGNLLEVRDQNNKVRPGSEYHKERPKAGEPCPEGQTQITAVKTIVVEYVTCADTNDPCWVCNPVTKICYRIC